MNKIAPVIVIGMHRSGTSMLSRLLDRTGHFSGWLKDCNNEARFFIHLNELILRRSGGTWDNPGPIDWLIEDHQSRGLMLDQMRELLRSPCSIAFSGRRGIAGERLPDGFAPSWGWKDPRNTITLPLWLQLFPAARVLHIMWHGVDVAASLRARQRLISERERRKRPRLRWSACISRNPPMANSARCMTLTGGFSLWLEYCERARLNLSLLPLDKKLVVRYEDFVERPGEMFTQVTDFCRIPREHLPEIAADEMKRQRSNAWTVDQELREFEIGVRDELRVHGY